MEFAWSSYSGATIPWWRWHSLRSMAAGTSSLSPTGELRESWARRPRNRTDRQSSGTSSCDSSQDSTPYHRRLLFDHCPAQRTRNLDSPFPSLLAMAASGKPMLKQRQSRVFTGFLRFGYSKYLLLEGQPAPLPGLL